MNDNPIGIYLSKQLREQEQVLRNYYYGPENQAKPKRELFTEIKSYIDAFMDCLTGPRWLVVPGLRGSGKTTVLAQIFFEYEEEFDSRILYLSLDELVNKLGSDLYQAIDQYEQLLHTSFANVDKPIILLVDEVHYDPKWALALKTLYDKSPKVFIVSTGSSAIDINLNTDITRRSYTIKSYPLKFSEYLDISGKISRKRSLGLGQKIKDAIFAQANFEQSYQELKLLADEVMQIYRELDKFEIENYLKFYSLPSVLEIKNLAQIYQVLNKVMERIILKDIATQHSLRQPVSSKIEQLLFLLASSELISQNSLSETLGLDVKSLQTILDILEKSELLVRVLPYGSSSKKSRRPSKFFFMAPSMRASILSLISVSPMQESFRGKLLEDALALCFKREVLTNSLHQLSYDSKAKSADFIYENPQRKFIIEIGFNKNSYKQIMQTKKNTGIQEGVLISNGNLDYKSKDQVLILPMEYFFLI